MVGTSGGQYLRRFHSQCDCEFRREGTDVEKRALAELSQARATSNSALEFLALTARNATESSDFVARASATYRTPVDYGTGGGIGGNLQRVAALVAAHEGAVEVDSKPGEGATFRVRLPLHPGSAES